MTKLSYRLADGTETSSYEEAVKSNKEFEKIFTDIGNKYEDTNLYYWCDDVIEK